MQYIFPSFVLIVVICDRNYLLRRYVIRSRSQVNARIIVHARQNEKDTWKTSRIKLEGILTIDIRVIHAWNVKALLRYKKKSRLKLKCQPYYYSAVSILNFTVELRVYAKDMSKFFYIAARDRCLTINCNVRSRVG